MSPSNIDWDTPGLLDALRAKWESGKSASVVARELTHQFRIPIGKNAVCGKKNRMEGLVRRPSPTLQGNHTVPPEKRQLIEPMLRNGLSNNAISNRARSGESTVRRLREELGIAPFKGGVGRVNVLLPMFPHAPDIKPAYMTERPRVEAPAPRIIRVVKFSSVRTCTWVGGMTGPDAPCDQKTAYGTSWCDGHGRRCFSVWPPRRLADAA